MSVNNIFAVDSHKQKLGVLAYHSKTYSVMSNKIREICEKLILERPFGYGVMWNRGDIDVEGTRNVGGENDVGNLIYIVQKLRCRTCTIINNTSNNTPPSI